MREEIGPVAACWLSGSFFTDKTHPGDIDSLFLIHHKVLDAVDPDSDGGRLITVMNRYQVKNLLGCGRPDPALVATSRRGPSRQR